MERTTQLNVRVPVVLAEQLRKASAERHMLPGALVRQALEQFLAADSGSSPALSSDSGKLEQRLAELEQRVAKLEQRPRPAAPPPPAPPAAAPTPPPSKPSPMPLGGEGLTTVQLADHLGLKRGSLNERIRRAGGASVGLQIEGWRIVGQAKPPQGGPPQWLWELGCDNSMSTKLPQKSISNE